MTDLAATVMERCEALGKVSEEPDLLVRPFASEAMRRTNDLVTDWMRAAGMTVRSDEIRNLIGRYEGRDEAAGRLSSARTLIRCAMRENTTVPSG